MPTFHHDSFTQQLLIATVLGGFSFSCASQLITASVEKRVPYYVATAAFILASATFVGLLLSNGLLLMGAHRLSELSSDQLNALSSFKHITAITFVAGLGLLLLGSALLGWVHSRVMGLVSLAGVVVVLEILRRVLPLLRAL